MKVVLLMALVGATCWLAFELGQRSVDEPELRDEVVGVSGKEDVVRMRTDREWSLRLREGLSELKTREEFRSALYRLIVEADKTEENRMLAEFFAEWLEKDPAGALAEVRGVESLRHDLGRVSRVFENWARENPAEAEVLFKKVLAGDRAVFLDGVDPPVYVFSLFGGLLQNNVASVAGMLVEAEESRVRRDALNLLVHNWFAQDKEALFGWMDGLAESRIRTEAVGLVASRSGQEDPHGGIVWAMKFDEVGLRELALRVITGQWAQRQSREAFAWVDGLADERLKLTLMPDVLRSLMPIDPGAAADWLNQFEAGPEMDASVAAYAEGVAAVNPAAAMESARVITDARDREKVMVRIARGWLGREPEGLKNYLEKTKGLPKKVSELLHERSGQ